MSTSPPVEPLRFQDYLISIMLVILVAAIVAGAAPRKLSRLFPAPVLMFILTLSISLIAMAVDRQGFVFDITDSNINSDALQTVYLPPLLFSDVMRLNLRTFKRSFWQVLWLVFPGVVGGAVLTALYPWFFMPSGPPYFSAYEALSFGAALSTTDPIAVLMVLNDIGAPKRLAALVGGESLLNDGSSIVIVTLFLQLQEGITMTGGDIVAFCFQEILAGPCVGLVVGMFTLIAMSYVEKHTVALVTLSFAVPYLTFAVCMYYLKTSGVLAVITLGLVLNRFGHSFLSKELEAVEGFWDQVEFIATMILYAQVGLFVASDFLQGSITGTDWGSLIGIFLWVLLVRLIVVLVSFPILTRIGYGLSWKEAIIVWHAGLRGGVSVLLSFSIKNSPGVDPQTGALVLFFTAGIVFLFLINIVTTGPLCRLLGLQFDSSNKVYGRMRFRIEDTTLRTLMCTGMNEEVARNGIEFYAKEARSILNPPQSQQEILAAQKQLTFLPSLRSDLSVDQEMLAIKRQHLCMAFKTTFEGLMETELIPRKAWFLLVSSCEKKIDATPVLSLLRFEDIVASSAYFGIYARLVLALSRVPSSCKKHGSALDEQRVVLKEVLLNGFSESTRLREGVYEDLMGTVELLAYCAFGLIIAHQRGRRTIHEIFSVLKDEDEDPLKIPPNGGGGKQDADVDEAENAGETKTRVTGKSRELSQILRESKDDCVRPALFLDIVLKLFPKVVARIKSTHARAQVHHQNVKVLGGMKRDGFIAGVALKQLMKELEGIDTKVSKLEFPVVPPLTVGRAGLGLSTNPNFGPFVGLRKRRTSRLDQQNQTVPESLVGLPPKPDDDQTSPYLEKQHDETQLTSEPEFPLASASDQKTEGSTEPADTDVTGGSDVNPPESDSQHSNGEDPVINGAVNDLDLIPAEISPLLDNPHAEVSEQLPEGENVLSEGVPGASSAVSELSQGTASEEHDLQETALEHILDRMEDMLADQIEDDRDLRVTL